METMTFDEAELFLKEVAFIAFPAPRQWVVNNSVDATATFQLWARILTAISKADAVAVINAWSTGQLPMFSYDESTAWGTTIVATSRTMHRTRNERQRTAQLLEEIGHGPAPYAYVPLVERFEALRVFKPTEIVKRADSDHGYDPNEVHKNRAVIDAVFKPMIAEEMKAKEGVPQ